MFPISIRYWAGAAAAAGVDEESIAAPNINEALAIARAGRGAEFAKVLAVSAVLVEGVTASNVEQTRPLTGPAQVEILPPFAGG